MSNEQEISEMNQAATDINAVETPAPATPLRFVTAASLFDGHDAAINIMRRLIQAQGCEVIHLGHNRSVLDIVRAAIQEDADAIAISSYQGGHNEYFRFMIDELKQRGAGHIQVFGGGGGTITLDEIAELEAVVDNLVMTRSTKDPFCLYMQIERIKESGFVSNEIEVPFSADLLTGVKEIADHSRKRVIPLVSKL